MYNDDTDNLYWEDDFDGSNKGFNDDNDDPYSKQFGFHVSDEDEEETDTPTLPIDDDEPLIDEDLKLGGDEKEETEE